MALSGWAIFLLLLLVVLILGAIGYYLYSHYRANKLGLPPPPLNPFAHLTASGRRRAAATAANDPYRGPSPAPGGLQGWVNSTWSRVRHSARFGGRGAYESTTAGVGGGGGYDEELPPRRPRGAAGGAFDPDEAWDVRVDQETGPPGVGGGGMGGGSGGGMGVYDEDEHALGLHAGGPYGGGGYGGGGYGGASHGYSGSVGGGAVEGRGRSRSRQRELDERYDAEMGRAPPSQAAGANPFGDHAEASNMSLRSVSPRPAAEEVGGASASRDSLSRHQRGVSSLTAGSGGGAGSPTERRSIFTEDMD